MQTLDSFGLGGPHQQGAIAKSCWSMKNTAHLYQVNKSVNDNEGSTTACAGTRGVCSSLIETIGRIEVVGRKIVLDGV